MVRSRHCRAVLLAASLVACHGRWEPLDPQPTCEALVGRDSTASALARAPLRVGADSAPAGTLRVTVMAVRTDRPVTQASADLTRDGFEHRATSDSLGHVEWPGLKPGSYVLHLRRVGVGSRTDTLTLAAVRGLSITAPLGLRVWHDDRCHVVVAKWRPWWKFW